MVDGDLARVTDAADPASKRLKERGEAWNAMRDDIAKLAAAGVTVVAPAGDAGPDPQSVLGLAGLPEVLAVGAFDGKGVAPVSASGPSLHGGVKPDLAGPTGLPGLVPEKSALGVVLGLTGRMSRNLHLELPAEPAGGRRVALGSTLPAATLVAAGVAQLKADGVSRPDEVRGVLLAAAEPLPGVAAWRQGAGILRAMPTAALADQRPLVSGPADLGAEPPSGSSGEKDIAAFNLQRAWRTDLAVLGGRLAGPVTSEFPWRIETTPAAGKQAVTVTEGPVPVPAVKETDSGFTVSLTAGDNPWAAGAWCGYVHLPLTGLADVLEDVPGCLVEGLSLTAFNFYIHDQPAENLTFALLPALPPGAGLLDGPLHLLPLDPLHEPLYAGVSGKDGLVHFRNVPPAFFLMRQFSDYGAPVTEPDGQRARDLGEAVSYLNFEALVLPNPCSERIADHQATGTDCHRAFLERTFGGTVGYDKTTTRYLVDSPAGRIGVVFDFTKKFAGVGVSSRYVDLLAHPDLEYGTPVSLEEIAGVGLGLEQAWASNAGGAGDPEGTASVYKGLDLNTDPKSLAGLAHYPFSLTTPNYKGSMSLNFGYVLDNAVMAVAVKVADEVHAAVITPKGTLTLPPLGSLGAGAVELPQTPLAEEAQKLATQANEAGLLPPVEGKASFDFHIKPGGADRGDLFFLHLPINPAKPARVEVGERSFEITTWQRIDWPPAEFDRDGVHTMGHAFSFDSNYDARQMNHPACRTVEGTQVCENWQVMVHSPLDDAETFELVDTATGAGFMAEVRAGDGGLFNPRRGVHGKRQDLALGGFTLPLGKGIVTNGRFWEQLVVRGPALAAHPGPVEVRLADNVPGRTSPLLPHTDGPVMLAPYRPFKNTQRQLLDLSPLTARLPKPELPAPKPE
jgi:hypothetical protein